MSNQCNQCGSYAINHHHHGRDGSDPDLCDVCYWHTRNDQLQEELAEVKADLALALKVPSIAAMHTWLDSECAKQNKQLEAELAALKAKAVVPDVLFDGYAVYNALERRDRTSPENVADVLDAVVRLIRAAPAQPQSDAVIVPRELLERIDIYLDANYESRPLLQELRALLGGDQPAQPQEDPLEWSRKHGIEEF